MTGRHFFFSQRRHREPTVSQEVEIGRNRLMIASALFAAAFAVVAVRLVDVTLLGESDTARLAQSSGKALHKTGRADIIDRNSVLLASSLKTASLFANPRDILNADEAAAKLVSQLPDLNEAKVRAKLKSGRGFVWIKRHLTPQQQYDINRLGIPGLDFQTEERRLYPSGALTAHLLGHTDIDSRGLMGIENQFDTTLRNRQAPFRLSLDLRVQHVMRQELSRSMKEFRAVGAAGIVMDVRNGEVLSMVSLPDFDPNQPDQINDDARFNRSTLGVYEMGSTFKIFTTAMVLDSGKVTMRGGYDATKPIEVSRFTIRDFHAKKRWLSVPEIFMYSSNIGSSKMADDVGAKNHKAFLAKIGMLDKPSIELPEIGAPILPPRWNSLETMTISFGHGLSVSPLQLSTGIAAMINGGNYVNPTVIRRDLNKGLLVREVISPKTSDTIRRLMRLVVEKGTGGQAAAKGYLVGGKTGTAEKVEGGRYKRNALLTSFVSAFPMNNPRYVVLAMLDEPKGNASTHGFRSAGWTAAPIVGRLITRIGPILGIAPIDEESDTVRKAMFIPINSREKKLASF